MWISFCSRIQVVIWSLRSETRFFFIFPCSAHSRCTHAPNPSVNDPLCKQFRSQHPRALIKPSDEALLFSNLDQENPIRSCYAPGSGSRGWCGTCALTAKNLSDPHLCVIDPWNPYSVEADKHWGWCNKLCHDQQVSSVRRESLVSWENIILGTFATSPERSDIGGFPA